MQLTRTISERGVFRKETPALEHIVFALTAQEKRLFFERDPLNSRLDARETWVDTARIDSKVWEDTLRDLRPTVLVTAWSCPALPSAWAQEEDCPLRYFCSITGSVKPRIPRGSIANGLIVSNWGALVSCTVAEHAMLMVLALLRGMAHWPELMEKPRSMFEMMPLLRSRTLRGRCVGLHGFGAVARELVGMLRPYGADIAVYSEGVPKALMDEFGVCVCGSLAELFSRSEVLIECEGLNEQSRGSVNERILRLLPDDAVFVNVGRGAIVDEDALAALAREGRLRVGLDVFRKEPVPANSPLLDNPGVLLSPHVAGPTWDTYTLCGEQALTNLDRYLRGEVPENLVTLEIYDRTT